MSRVVLLLAVVLTGCPPLSAADAGRDGGVADGGNTDAGSGDAGPGDAAVPDAGTVDAGEADAGADAGLDGGPFDGACIEAELAQLSGATAAWPGVRDT